MNKTIKIYIVFLILLLAGVIYIDGVRPKPINWNPTFDLRHKIPFGLYVLDQEASKLFRNHKINKIEKTPYEYFEPLYVYDTVVDNYSVNGTILVISDNYALDNASSKELFYFVGHGNSAFISAKDFPSIFNDSLNIITTMGYNLNAEIALSFANKKIKPNKYKFKVGASSSYFEKIDTLNTTVLGYQQIDTVKQVNFVKVGFGKGYFYLHTQPIAFTNYHLLKDNHYQYVESLLSYIPKGKVFWMVKNHNGELKSASPMRFILGQPALKWAWYLSILGLLIFMIFNAKRRQRVVPIINPLPNTTLEFTKTIGNLYYQEGDHQNIVDKKIIYFLEKIRNDYLIDTNVLDENFIKKLHQKSGKDLVDIQKAVQLINALRKDYYQSVEEDLININNAIEKITN